MAKRKTKAQIPTLRLKRNDLSTGKRVDDIRYSSHNRSNASERNLNHFSDLTVLWKDNSQETAFGEVSTLDRDRVAYAQDYFPERDLNEAAARRTLRVLAQARVAKPEYCGVIRWFPLLPVYYDEEAMSRNVALNRQLSIRALHRK